MYPLIVLISNSKTFESEDRHQNKQKYNLIFLLNTQRIGIIIYM